MSAEKNSQKPILLISLVLVGALFGFILAIGGLSIGGSSRPSTLQAETPVMKAPADVKAALAQAESVQNAFRYVAKTVQPSVVELSVVSAAEAESQGGNPLPFDFFFGPKDNGDGQEPDSPREERGLGSGIIVRRDGKTVFILTNDHVVGKAKNIKVIMHDEREFEAKLVGTDERKDLALVKFETDASDISVATLGDSSRLEVGDWAIAVGSPLGYVSSVTTGIISALGRSGGPEGNISDFIQTDAAINRGNSGGALVNIYGEVIGINTWIASTTGGSIGLGFAIPINNAKSAIDDFIRHGQVKYGWLGVSLLGRTSDKESAKELGIDGKKGAFVSQVFVKGPADKAGILPGDYIIEAEGKTIRGQDDFVRIVGSIPSGTNAKFNLIRGGNNVTVIAKIEDRDKNLASNDANLFPGLDVVSLKSDLLVKERMPKDVVSGVVVVNVSARAPAATIGIKAGDIIVAVGEHKVSGLGDFYKTLNDKSEKKMSFTVIRDGQEITTLAYTKK